ncbi:MAG: hypothetical protein ACE5D8_09670 [Fidelibacterota bacterium]
MNVESTLKYMLHHREDQIDSDVLLQRFHSLRAERYRRRSQRVTGIAALLLLGLVSILTLQQISSAPFDSGLTVESTDVYEEELTEDVYLEFASYLVDESEDLWETVEFLYDIDYEPITELITGGS